MKILNCRFNYTPQIKESVGFAQDYYQIEKHSYAAKPAIIKMLAGFKNLVLENKRLKEEISQLQSKK